LQKQFEMVLFLTVVLRDKVYNECR